MERGRQTRERGGETRKDGWMDKGEGETIGGIEKGHEDEHVESAGEEEGCPSFR